MGWRQLSTLVSAMVGATLVAGCSPPDARDGQTIDTASGAVSYRDNDTARPTAVHSSTTLENTVWKLAELDGSPPRVASNMPAPNLRLIKAEMRVNGSTGCNTFSGSFARNGRDSLRFGPLSSTRRACVDPEMNRQERAMLDALAATQTSSFNGDTLVLASLSGPVAKLVAMRAR